MIIVVFHITANFSHNHFHNYNDIKMRMSLDAIFSIIGVNRWN